MRRFACQQVSGPPPGALVLGSAGWIGGLCILTDVELAYWPRAGGLGRLGLLVGGSAGGAGVGVSKKGHRPFAGFRLFQ